MTVAPDLARLIAGWPQVEAEEQAFPFLTVDDAGFPHVALLSRSELDIGVDGSEILAAIRSTRTLANLHRDGRAGLIAVGGTTAHYLKMQALRSQSYDDGLVAWAFEVVEHKRDSLGIPLQPMSFHTSPEVARIERWQASADALKTVAGQRA